TTSLGRDGFKERNRSPVLTRSPATINSYSRPNSARTCSRARSIRRRLAGSVKSVYDSFSKAALVRSAAIVLMDFNCVLLRAPLHQLAPLFEQLRRLIGNLAASLV